MTTKSLALHRLLPTCRLADLPNAIEFFFLDGSALPSPKKVHPSLAVEGCRLSACKTFRAVQAEKNAMKCKFLALRAFSKIFWGDRIVEFVVQPMSIQPISTHLDCLFQLLFSAEKGADRALGNVFWAAGDQKMP